MSEQYKFHDKDALYFVTPTIVGWIDVFTKKEYCEVVLESLQFCQKGKGLIIYAWCIMSSHLHLIISTTGEDLSNIMRDFKKFTSKRIIEHLENGNDSRKGWMLNLFAQSAGQINRNKKYKVWQDGNHPILLDTNEMLDQRVNYIHNNAVEQGIISNEIDYVYSSAKDYASEKGLLQIEIIQ